MSPEQARGAADVDERTDVWSLGVVLYELLTGRKPFEGTQFLEVVHQILGAEPTPLATLRPGIPARLSAAVERAMTKGLEQRFPTVGAFAEALGPFAMRAPTPQVRAAAPAELTQPTPATGPSDRSSERSREGVATPVRPRGAYVTRPVVVGMVVAASVVAGLLVVGAARKRDVPASIRVSSVPVLLSPRTASVADSPSRATNHVRTVSEQSEPVPDRPRPSPSPGDRPGKRAAARVETIPPPPAAAVTEPRRPASRAINIETENPY
jgi:serine/threonine protein kinase